MCYIDERSTIVNYINTGADVFILPDNHLTLYPQGQRDQISINQMKRGSRQYTKPVFSAVWLQPYNLATAS